MGWADEALTAAGRLGGRAALDLLSAQVADRWLSVRFDVLGEHAGSCG
jgi:hypothetical protein